MAKTTYQGPADRLDAYEALVARFDGVERKGAGAPYTSLNGWMTSFLDPEGRLSLRLSAADQVEFAAAHGARATIQHGVVMKDFLEVPNGLLADADALTPWFQRSLDWTATLKPKKTTRVAR